MTSWKRGLTCQQLSTTIQPSRPSKAEPVQRPQLFLHTALLSRRGAVVHTAWFLFLEDLAIWLQGLPSTLKLSCLFRIYMLPKTPTLVLFLLFLFLFFFFLSCLDQGLCYVYVCKSEACFLPEEDWPCGMEQWQNKGSTSYLQQVLRTQKKVEKIKLTSSDAGEGVKELQCLLLHYI